ncbi:glycosyltransferase [Mucilaginibacter sp. HMF5004]|uniref:glycosyltransferase family 2 protein n=1 Tax=Mucilaginibacter rivuli TaxID=2857527 RepID=UPI001C603061|nr:glycosyltransferase family 2 protein [Mucilaginibacter rivuli]MBW4888440.1 glycosyltransferase [Mucilaginibacter rivuli]
MILSICIPTYNRRNKIGATLKLFYDQIISSGYAVDIELLVSNNGSTDDTKALLDDLNYTDIAFSVFHQPQNLGFDLNIKFLFAEAKGKYVWYFGDDDIVFEGAVKTVFDCIKGENYGGMRFEFMQPIGNHDLDFGFSDELTSVITDPERIAKLCFTLPKVSTYIIKRVEPIEELFNPIAQYENEGYWFIALSVRVFEMMGDDSEGLLIYHKQVASCDDDIFEELNVPPAVWNNRTRIAEYPFVKMHAPTFAAKLFKDDYRYTIDFLWKHKKGDYKVRNPEENDRFIKSLKIRLPLLLSRRKLLFKLIVLKLNLFPLVSRLSKGK